MSPHILSLALTTSGRGGDTPVTLREGGIREAGPTRALVLCSILLVPGLLFGCSLGDSRPYQDGGLLPDAYAFDSYRYPDVSDLRDDAYIHPADAQLYGDGFVPDAGSLQACDLSGFWTGTRSDTTQSPAVVSPIAFLISQVGDALSGPNGLHGMTTGYAAQISVVPYPEFARLYDGTSSPGCDSISGTWRGGNTATGPFTLNRASGVQPLTIVKTGTGARSNNVTSIPAGLDCNDSCTAPFNPGTSVMLFATAAPGTAFAGWSGGGCSGLAGCSVTVNSPTTVTPRFDSCLLDAEALGSFAGWSYNSNIQAHGGAFLSALTGSSMSFTSWATQLAVYFEAGPSMGELSVSIDGGAPFLIDTSAGSRASRARP